MAGARTAFADMRYTVVALVAEGDTVALLDTWTGSHTGELGGVPAPGRAVSATVAIFCRLDGGGIVRVREVGTSCRCSAERPRPRCGKKP
jgi:predicted ester cyclase